MLDKEDLGVLASWSASQLPEDRVTNTFFLGETSDFLIVDQSVRSPFPVRIFGRNQGRGA
jgi:hypothetical protein